MIKNASLSDVVVSTSLLTDISDASNEIRTILPSASPTTDVESVNQSLEALESDPLKYRKLMTVPVVKVSITIKGKQPALITCYPITNAILKVPKKGDWIMIIGVQKSMLKAESSGDENPNYFYYYVPYSYYAKRGDYLERVTDDIRSTGPSAKKIL